MCGTPESRRHVGPSLGRALSARPKSVMQFRNITLVEDQICGYKWCFGLSGLVRQDFG